MTGSRSWARSSWLAVLLLCAGAFLRLWDLGAYPLAVNQDELSEIYDAWCLAETGSDRFASPAPLVLRGFGDLDYRPALHAWLGAGAVKLLGFSVASGRAVAALLGSLSLLLLYRIVLDWSGKPHFALFSLLLASVQPWHLLFSRMAHQGAFFPAFFTVLTLFLWQRAFRRSYDASSSLLLGLCLGASTSGYQSLKLSSLVLAGGVLGHMLWRGRAGARAIGIFLAAGLLGAGPQLWVLLTDPGHFFARARDVAGPEAGGAVLALSTLRNLAANLDPSFLFTVDARPNNLSIGRLLAVEVLLFYPGFVWVSRHLSAVILPRWTLFLATAAALLPAAVVAPNPHALRASAASLLLSIFSAATLTSLVELPSRPGRRRLLAWGLALLVAMNAAVTIGRYATDPDLRNEGQQHLLVLLGEKVGTLRHRYAEVVVEPYGNQPYLYVAAFGGISPREFQKMPRAYVRLGWDRWTALGNIRWEETGTMERMSREPGRAATTVFLSRSPLSSTRIVDSVAWGRERFWVQVP